MASHGKLTKGVTAMLKDYEVLLVRGYHYSNCWGTTMWTLNQFPEETAPPYVDGPDMDDWLYANTHEIDETDVEVGDIAVWRGFDAFRPAEGYNCLLHTAINVGPDQWFGQNGCGGPFDVCPLAWVPYDGDITFRRVDLP